VKFWCEDRGKGVYYSEFGEKSLFRRFDVPDSIDVARVTASSDRSHESHAEADGGHGLKPRLNGETQRGNPTSDTRLTTSNGRIRPKYG